MKRIANLIFFLIFHLVASNIVLAANHYVRAGAEGDISGADWINAYTTLPSNLIRGDTYYIADGSYPGYDFETPTSGPMYIYIKKATDSDHGTDTGWISSYGDGVAHFNDTVSFYTSYWEFDGQIGSRDSGHGFKITTNNCNTGSKLIRIRNGSDYITISHVEAEHCGEDYGDYSHDGIYVFGSGTSENITISYCYIHDIVRNPILIADVDGVVIEHCFISNRHQPPGGPHGQGIQGGPPVCTDVTVRYCTFKDIKGTGQIVALDNTHHHWYVYGNVFYRTDTSRYYSTDATFTNTSGDTSNYMHYFNNTEYNMQNAGCEWETAGTENYAYNNIFYGCNLSWLRTNHDYNLYYDSGGVQGESHGSIEQPSFSNLANYDFSLTSRTANGIELSPPYDRDSKDNIRGADGNWDRGAFEYVSGAGNPPAPPLNLNVHDVQ